MPPLPAAMLLFSGGAAGRPLEGTTAREHVPGLVPGLETTGFRTERAGKGGASRHSS